MTDERQPIQDRLTELEIALAHQQRLTEQLNEVVTDQTQRLMRLEALIPKLEKQLQELRTKSKQDTNDIPNERPPHY